jgi:uncharacterized protein (DUF433 family)
VQASLEQRQRFRQLFFPAGIAFDGNGRPVLKVSAVPTAVIADRYKAGESIADLADDYGEDPLNIEEAVRCELQPAKAA